MKKMGGGLGGVCIFFTGLGHFEGGIRSMRSFDPNSCTDRTESIQRGWRNLGKFLDDFGAPMMLK